jgi:hypothetical protein
MTGIAVPKLVVRRIDEAVGAGVRRPAYDIEYSPGLARDGDGSIIAGVTCEQAGKLLQAQGFRLPTAAELKVLGEAGYRDSVFDDYFGRNPDRKPYIEWTATGLHKSKRGKQGKAEGGREYCRRIVTECGKKVGELWVPESGIVREWSPFGIPSKTVDDHQDGSETHFQFVTFDNVDVHRCWDSYDVSRDDCFRLVARFDPNDEMNTNDQLGFRLVRGPLPAYEKLVAA